MEVSHTYIIEDIRLNYMDCTATPILRVYKLDKTYNYTSTHSFIFSPLPITDEKIKAHSYLKRIATKGL